MDKKLLYVVILVLGFSWLITAAGVLFLYLENEGLKISLLEQGKQLNTTIRMLTTANDDIHSLNRSLVSTTTQLQQTQNELANTSGELNTTKQQLFERSQQLNESNRLLQLTGNLLNQTRVQFNELKTELSSMERSINESIQWFKSNSLLPSSIDFFTYRVESYCVVDGTIKLGCINYLMQDKLHYGYIYEDPDRLYSIDEMLKRHGGDCEDYSLFLKAVLNTMKTLQPTAQVQAWTPGAGQYIIFEEQNGSKTIQWFVNGEATNIGRLGDLNPYIVCFAVDQNSGHCIVALAQNNISSITDLQQLDGAGLFEPQNGAYMGEIGKQLAVCKDGQPGCDRAPQYISFVITDDDLYQFKDGRWKSYQVYLQDASSIGSSIGNALGETN
ncbi:MAG: hypothetical protein V1492_01825 [Candidatus Micrarchaeota archaeon]